ncbi:MAG: hypothetical protein AAF283_07565 [Cyanobacteria bacterium P01_A01_bin.70]
MQPEASHPNTARMLALRRVWMRRWWLVTLGLWATAGVISIWSLRRTWQQAAEHFTWAAIRYGLAFNRLAAAGLGLCVGLTVALLVKEARFLLFGLTPQERRDLLKALQKRP